MYDKLQDDERGSESTTARSLIELSAASAGPTRRKCRTGYVEASVRGGATGWMLRTATRSYEYVSTVAYRCCAAHYRTSAWSTNRVHIQFRRPTYAGPSRLSHCESRASNQRASHTAMTAYPLQDAKPAASAYMQAFHPSYTTAPQLTFTSSSSSSGDRDQPQQPQQPDTRPDDNPPPYQPQASTSHDTYRKSQHLSTINMYSLITAPQTPPSARSG